MKKKRERRDRENMEHRGNNKKLIRQFQLEMDVVHSVPESYYTMEGEMKYNTSDRRK